ncbi:MAG: hypothetical protein K1X79_10115 [Oligoflexia bacterium]|nr:hypothetical protein [Oligoflexia bacterium]
MLAVPNPNGPTEEQVVVKRLADIPREKLSEFLDAALTQKDKERLLASIAAAERSEDPAILVAVAPGSDVDVVALGTATMSMHAFSNWGINLAAIKPGWEDTQQVSSLVAALVKHTEQNYAHLVEAGHAEALALSTGTTQPQLFHALGFKPVHTHAQAQGDAVTWLLRVTPSDGTVFQAPVSISTPKVHPMRQAEVRPLQGDDALRQALALVQTFWGEEGAKHFAAEIIEIRGMPGSEVYAYYEGEKVLGVGAIIKALHHQEAWSRAWIVVDQARRSGGLGQKIIQTLLAHAHENHPKFSDSPVLIMEGFTYTPDYYLKYGNQPIAARDFKRGLGTWTMRAVLANNIE